MIQDNGGIGNLSYVPQEHEEGEKDLYSLKQ